MIQASKGRERRYRRQEENRYGEIAESQLGRRGGERVKGSRAWRMVDEEREAISIFLKARSPGCVHYSRKKDRRRFFSYHFGWLPYFAFPPLLVVFHSLICSVITTKNDRERFRLYLRKKSLPASTFLREPPFLTSRS